MRRSPLTLILLAALVALLLPATSAAQSSARPFLIDVSPGRADVPIGLPLPASDPAWDEASKAIWDVVQRDLVMSGYFEIIDPKAYIDTSDAVEPGSFQYQDWRLLKAAGLAKTRVAARPDGKLQADVFVYDVGAGAKLSGKRFVGDAGATRYLGHKIADEILLAITGQSGIFGARVAAVGARTGNKEIYVMDIDGHGVRAATRNGSINLSPAWSPDGSQLAWTSYKRGNPDLYVKDTQRGGSRVLSAREGINTGATFSPDGTKVALARSTNGDSDIYILDARTGAELQRVTTGGGIDVAPDWHPSGTMLAYASERSGGSQIYVHDLSTGQARRVTFHGSFNGDPVWSPDGTKLAFVGRDRNFDVFTVQADGKNMSRITQDQGNNEDPDWSPDGRYLVFSSTRNGRSEIWMSSADGRHQVPVTPGSGGWTQPTWAP